MRTGRGPIDEGVRQIARRSGSRPGRCRPAGPAGRGRKGCAGRRSNWPPWFCSTTSTWRTPASACATSSAERRQQADRHQTQRRAGGGGALHLPRTAAVVEPKVIDARSASPRCRPSVSRSRAASTCAGACRALLDVVARLAARDAALGVLQAVGGVGDAGRAGNRHRRHARGRVGITLVALGVGRSHSGAAPAPAAPALGWSITARDWPMNWSDSSSAGDCSASASCRPLAGGGQSAMPLGASTKRGASPCRPSTAKDRSLCSLLAGCRWRARRASRRRRRWAPRRLTASRCPRSSAPSPGQRWPVSEGTP